MPVPVSLTQPASSLGLRRRTTDEDFQSVASEEGGADFDYNSPDIDITFSGADLSSVVLNTTGGSPSKRSSTGQNKTPSPSKKSKTYAPYAGLPATYHQSALGAGGGSHALFADDGDDPFGLPPTPGVEAVAVAAAPPGVGSSSSTNRAIKSPTAPAVIPRLNTSVLSEEPALEPLKTARFGTEDEPGAGAGEETTPRAEQDLLQQHTDCYDDAEDQDNFCIQRRNVTEMSDREEARPSPGVSESSSNPFSASSCTESKAPSPLEVVEMITKNCERAEMTGNRPNKNTAIAVSPNVVGRRLGSPRPRSTSGTRGPRRWAEIENCLGGHEGAGASDLSSEVVGSVVVGKRQSASSSSRDGPNGNGGATASAAAVGFSPPKNVRSLISKFSRVSEELHGAAPAVQPARKISAGGATSIAGAGGVTVTVSRTTTRPAHTTCSSPTRMKRMSPVKKAALRSSAREQEVNVHAGSKHKQSQSGFGLEDFGLEDDEATAASRSPAKLLATGTAPQRGSRVRDKIEALARMPVEEAATRLLENAGAPSPEDEDRRRKAVGGFGRRPGSEVDTVNIIRAAFVAIDGLRESFKASPPMPVRGAVRTQRAHTTSGVEMAGSEAEHQQARFFPSSRSRQSQGDVVHFNDSRQKMKATAVSPPPEKKKANSPKKMSPKKLLSPKKYSPKKFSPTKGSPSKKHQNSSTTPTAAGSAAFSPAKNKDKQALGASPKRRTPGNRPSRRKNPFLSSILAGSGPATRANSVIATTKSPRVASSLTQQQPNLKVERFLQPSGSISVQLPSRTVRDEAVHLSVSKNLNMSSIDNLHDAAGGGAPPIGEHEENIEPEEGLSDPVPRLKQSLLARSSETNADSGVDVKTAPTTTTTAGPSTVRSTAQSRARSSPAKSKKQTFRSASRIREAALQEEAYNDETEMMAARTPPSRPPAATTTSRGAASSPCDEEFAYGLAPASSAGKQSSKSRNFVRENKRSPQVQAGVLLGTPREFQPVLRDRPRGAGGAAGGPSSFSSSSCSGASASSSSSCEQQEHDPAPAGAGSRGRSASGVRDMQQYWNAKVRASQNRDLSEKSRKLELVERGKARAPSVLERLERERDENGKGVTPRKTGEQARSGGGASSALVVHDQNNGNSNHDVPGRGNPTPTSATRATAASSSSTTTTTAATTASASNQSGGKMKRSRSAKATTGSSSFSSSSGCPAGGAPPPPSSSAAGRWKPLQQNPNPGPGTLSSRKGAPTRQGQGSVSTSGTTTTPVDVGASSSLSLTSMRTTASATQKRNPKATPEFPTRSFAELQASPGCEERSVASDGCLSFAGQQEGEGPGSSAASPAKPVPAPSRTCSSSFLAHQKILGSTRPLILTTAGCPAPPPPVVTRAIAAFSSPTPGTSTASVRSTSASSYIRAVGPTAPAPPQAAPSSAIMQHETNIKNLNVLTSSKMKIVSTGNRSAASSSTSSTLRSYNPPPRSSPASSSTSTGTATGAALLAPNANAKPTATTSPSGAATTPTPAATAVVRSQTAQAPASAYSYQYSSGASRVGQHSVPGFTSTFASSFPRASPGTSNGLSSASAFGPRGPAASSPNGSGAAQPIAMTMTTPVAVDGTTSKGVVSAGGTKTPPRVPSANTFQLKCPVSPPKKALVVPKGFPVAKSVKPAQHQVAGGNMKPGGPAGINKSAAAAPPPPVGSNKFGGRVFGFGGSHAARSPGSAAPSPFSPVLAAPIVYPPPGSAGAQPTATSASKSNIQVEMQAFSPSESSGSCSASNPSPGDFTNSLLNRLNHYQSPNSVKDFEVLELIGKGTSGELYKVRPRSTFTPSPAFIAASGAGGTKLDLYALKIIRKSKVRQLRMQDFLLREIEVHSTLDHPHVLKFYDYFTDSRKVYLLLELCKSDLYALLKDRERVNSANDNSTSTHGTPAASVSTKTCFSEREAAEFMSQICKGFTYLHQNSVLHGDIKLENILIGRDGLVKIADFGTVCKSTTLKRSTFCGTLDYLAPEIVERGDPSRSAGGGAGGGGAAAAGAGAGPAAASTSSSSSTNSSGTGGSSSAYSGNLTDVWALGIMLYELLFGKPPFEDDDTRSTCKRILKKEPKIPGGGASISRECEQLIRRMLCKDPKARIQLAEVRESDFFRKYLGAGRPGAGG